MPLEQFVSDLTSGARGHFALHSYNLTANARLSALGADVHGFHFVGDVPPPRHYAQKRAFMFRDTYTDWHYHPTDETLMSQVKGAKEVLLLPPDRSTFETMIEISDKVLKLWNVDDRVFPRWKHLVPYRAVVAEGDALYIPTFWWHAVESMDDSFGWTVAWCWRSPLHMLDPRLAGVRHLIRAELFGRNMPITVAAATWSLLKRFGQPAFSV